MQLEFIKMNGAGNDFVLVDNRDRKISLTTEQVIRICDRHRGVGADGVMMLVPCDSKKADWAWEFFNSDGSKAEMCGNGARCFARYIQKVAGTPKNEVTFETLAGVIHATFAGDRVAIDLTRPHSLRLNEDVPLKSGVVTVHSLNTGVPHAVLFVKNADEAMVCPIGAELRYHAHFAPRGTNVNFVQLLGKDFIRVRTYERGVENETLACGTGVTAAALIAARLHDFSSPVKVQVQGGDLMEVSFDRSGDNFDKVRLTGPAEVAFRGTIEI